MSKKFQFLNRSEDVFPFVKEIQAAADKERNALGFLVPAAYEAAVHQQKIILALTSENKPNYAGHIMFGGVYPNARVFQTVVAKNHRGSGLAALLMNEFISHLEGQSYTAISAKVASDLTKANGFYNSHGFKTIRTISGGKSKGRLLYLREKLLDTPNLFNWEKPAQIITSLSFPSHIHDNSPRYLIDLNVIFDVVHNRARSDAAGALMKASFQNLIRVSVSEELVAELERNTQGRKSDPILEMVKNFWRVPNPPKNKIKEISEDIGPIIFPDRHSSGKLSLQDSSDITHLATAIHHEMKGFVTSENAILAAGEHLRLKYKIDVLSLYDVEQLVEDIPEASSDDFISQKLSLKTITGPECVKLLLDENLPIEAQPPSEGMKENKVRAVVGLDQNGDVVTVAWWTALKGPTPINHAYIYVKSLDKYEGLIFDSICGKISRQCSARDISLVELLVDASLSNRSELLKRNGFISTGAKHTHGEVFKKICLGDAIHQNNWSKMKLKISNFTDGLMLSGSKPKISDTSMVRIENATGRTQEVSVSDFERLLYPTLIVDMQTHAVISPIRKAYADDLFGIRKKQLSLLENSEAVLSRQRVYFCKPSARKCFEKSSLIFFYESGKGGGSKAIIAAARVTESNVAIVDELDESLLRLGVIDKTMLSKISIEGKQTVVFFENIVLFRKPVTLKDLLEFGCDNGSNFISSQNIPSEKAIKILMAGLSHD